MQKLAALFLSAALLFSLIVPAWADEPVPADDPTSTQTETDPENEVIRDAALEGDPNSVPPESVTEGTPAPEEDETPEDPADGAVTEGENTAIEMEAPEEVPAFSDVQGHWAEATLEWAYENGLLQGFEDGTMRPDASISSAEVITLLTRLHEPQLSGKANTDKYTAHTRTEALTGTEWYADAIDKAEFWGILNWRPLDNWSAISRVDAFYYLNSAFQLRDSYALPDLSAYTDVAFLQNAFHREIGYLLNAGYVQGHSGLMEPYSSLTRAEFLTILHRIVPNTVEEGAETPATGGSLLKGEAVNLKDVTLTAPIWVSCAAETLSFENVSAERVTVQAQALDEIAFAGENHINTLVLGGGNGEAFTFKAPKGTTIDTLIIGEHRGPVTVEGAVDTLIVSNEFTKLTIRTDELKQLILCNGNEVTLDDCKIPYAELHARSVTLLGSGTIDVLNSYCPALLPDEITVNGGESFIDEGIKGITVEKTAPELLAIGAPLTFSVTVTNPRERVCTIEWQIGGETVATERVTIGETAKTFSHTYPVEYSRNMTTQRELSFNLAYESIDDVAATHTANAFVTLENYSTNYYDKEALSLVKTGYIGDYTREWAENNDYDEWTKNAWINAKGYSSSTQYLIWINTTYQRVNIFEGSQGNWTLIRSNLCGTGRNGHNTPVGVYTVGTRTEGGWTTGSYHVCPVVRFKQGSGLAFHSRKYNAPNHKVMIDDSIGFPVSLGCIRMYDEDVWWIYDNIPQGTTVVVY